MKIAIGHSAYAGKPTVATTHFGNSREVNEFHSKAKAQQESLHSRIEGCKILDNCISCYLKVCKQTLKSVSIDAKSICEIIWFNMGNGHPLFEV